jgi:hypothetical protein
MLFLFHLVMFAIANNIWHSISDDQRIMNWKITEESGHGVIRLDKYNS